MVTRKISASATQDDALNSEESKQQATLRLRLSMLPAWQHVNDLAFAYYSDRADKPKRKALFDALTKPATPGGDPLLLQLARQVVARTKKGDLGASITYLSEETLSNVLLKTDAASGRPLASATGMLGHAYDPLQASFYTWFSRLLYNAFIDIARAQKPQNEVFEALSTALEDGAEGDMSVEDEVNQNRLRTAMDKAYATLEPGEQAVFLAISDKESSGESEEDIYTRLKLSRQQFRTIKEKIQTAFAHLKA